MSLVVAYYSWKICGLFSELIMKKLITTNFEEMQTKILNIFETIINDGNKDYNINDENDKTENIPNIVESDYLKSEHLPDNQIFKGEKILDKIESKKLNYVADFI